MTDMAIQLLSALIALVVFNLSFTLSMTRRMMKLSERIARIEGLLMALNDSKNEETKGLS